MLEITRIAINLLYFPCALSDYHFHNLVPVQRHNAHHGFVKRHYCSIQYLGY